MEGGEEEKNILDFIMVNFRNGGREPMSNVSVCRGGERNPDMVQSQFWIYADKQQITKLEFREICGRSRGKMKQERSNLQWWVCEWTICREIQGI